ncbi:HAD-IA family hydrolase [Pseudomonas sp. NCCP-436]|uniref:HAD-IA family hydrolase n=1 Tax=Pseudomonas sp. NCCP-436 TaxID=2842481 RepID=UPI001C7F8AF1|nr:HAD-IA family hydrolase [Pseudomonas sp. NCCP-436]GIZ13401.1 hydrolase [Pseudomonas sp. NCCP-436]
MPDYRLLIFDWDGTLANSIARIVEVMHLAADSCGLPRCSDDRVRGIIGLELGRAIGVLYPELDSVLAIDGVRRAYSEHYLLLEREPSPLYDGVVESLAAFRRQGYRLAVATGKGRSGLQRVLAGRGWLDYFDVTRCADETAGKPDPRMLHEILAHCAVEPEQALMVGDSTFDLQMARNAGMDSVAVGYGAQPLSVLRQHGPRLAINHFNELRAWLEGRPLQCETEASENVG